MLSHRHWKGRASLATNVALSCVCSQDRHLAFSGLHSPACPIHFWPVGHVGQQTWPTGWQLCPWLPEHPGIALAGQDRTALPVLSCVQSGGAKRRGLKPYPSPSWYRQVSHHQEKGEGRPKRWTAGLQVVSASSPPVPSTAVISDAGRKGEAHMHAHLPGSVLVLARNKDSSGQKHLCPEAGSGFPALSLGPGLYRQCQSSVGAERHSADQIQANGHCWGRLRGTGLNRKLQVHIGTDKETHQKINQQPSGMTQPAGQVGLV